MTLKTNKTDIRLSVRLSRAERDALRARAGSVGLSTYVRAQLFGEAALKEAKAKRTDLAKALGLLGQSGAMAALKELAVASRLHGVPADQETADAIANACRDIAEIKSLLMKALRIKER